MNRIALLALVAACGDNQSPGGDFVSGSRLELVTYALADGTTAVDHQVFYDSARGEDCTIVRFGSGSRFCMPVTAGGATWFTESTCTRVVGAERSDRDPPAYFVRYYELAGESSPSRLYRAGQPVEPPPGLWQQRDGICAGPTPADPAVAYYTVGDVVTPDDLVLVRATDEVKAGRLDISFDTTDDGWRAPGKVTDTELALPCVVASAPNAATTSCVPALPPVNYYADAACSEPLVTGDMVLHRDLPTGCARVVERGEPYLLTVFERIGEACVAVPLPGDALFRAGATHELATLTRSDGGGNRIHSIMLSHAVHDDVLNDTTLGADCALASGVCAPVSTVDVQTYFMDEQCTTLIDVAFVPTGSCELPALYAGGRRIGDVYAGTIYELSTGDRCAPYTPPPRFAVHVVGDAPVDLVTYERQR